MTVGGSSDRRFLTAVSLYTLHSVETERYSRKYFILGLKNNVPFVLVILFQKYRHPSVVFYWHLNF